MTIFRRSFDTSANLVVSRSSSDYGRGRPFPSSSLALKQSVIFAAMNLHASIESMMPVDVFGYSGGVKVSKPTPPVLVSPSSFAADHPESLADWLYARRMSLKGWGNVFGEVTAWNAYGLPAQIQLIPPEEVRLKIHNHRIVEYKFGNTVMKDTRSVWHERGPVLPGNPVGLNPIAYAMQATEVAAMGARFIADWFGNSATPGGILRNKEKELTRKERRAVKASWDASMVNGEVFVTGNDWEWIATQAKAAESGFLEAMNYADVQLCRLMDTPANMIDVAVTGGAQINYANITQKNLDFMVTRMGPGLKRTDDALSSLTPKPWFARLTREAFLAMDPVQRAELMKTQIESRQRTVSEVRSIDDRQPYTEADYAEFDRLFGSKNQNPTPKGLPA